MLEEVDIQRVHELFDPRPDLGRLLLSQHRATRASPRANSAVVSAIRRVSHIAVRAIESDAYFLILGTLVAGIVLALRALVIQQ